MRYEPEPRPHPRRWSESGPARALLFIGVVWGIAGAFMLLHDGLTQLENQLMKSHRVPTQLTVPAPEVGSTCLKSSGSLPESEGGVIADPAASQAAKYLRWRLGFNLGFAAGEASAGGADGVQLQKLMERERPLADALGVEAPTLPRVEHFANALQELQVYVEADPQCIATQLARRFSSQHGSLYKFGQVVGIATVYRAAVPAGGALFAVQVRRYGEAAGIPQALWQPMTQDSLDAIPGRGQGGKLLTLVTRIDEYTRKGK